MTEIGIVVPTIGQRPEYLLANLEIEAGLPTLFILGALAKVLGRRK
jgi:hypothetical protein